MNKPNIYILNGPNLNLLGSREPEIYGHESIEDIKNISTKFANELGLDVNFIQTNHEGDLIDWIHKAIFANKTKEASVAGIIINAGAYSHTSIAIYDALVAYDGIIIELHLSNPFKREEFRHHTFVSKIAKGIICGFGVVGYKSALFTISNLLKK